MTEFFNKLTNEIGKCSNIIIIGHKNPDLDCIASALGLYKIIEKECYIFKTTENTNSSSRKVYSILEEQNIKFLTKENYKQKINENTLLIIVDLHRKQLIEHEEIIDEVKKIVLIDHHIVGKEKINANIEYIDSTSSSVTEIIAKYIMQRKKEIDNITATIMLAGIEIDTNCFNIKTTEETFKVAAWLMKMGADNILKQNILKENKDEYIKRTKQIEQSYLINGNLMICVLDENTYNPSYLATLSEDLLRFDNVEASFTIGKLTNDKIGISARSLGYINVEEYMSLLGGGGHKTDAACQLEQVSLEEAENQLTQILTKQKGKTK